MTSPQIDDKDNKQSGPGVALLVHPGGRPKFIINYAEVFKLAQIHCTHTEIASHLGCSHDVLSKDEEFIVVYQKGLDSGRLSLRRAQFQKALGVPTILARDDAGKILLDEKRRPLVLVPGSAPDVTAQIWLGKQLLGQRDNVEIDTSKLHALAISVTIDVSSEGKAFKEKIKG